MEAQDLILWMELVWLALTLWMSRREKSAPQPAPPCNAEALLAATNAAANRLHAAADRMASELPHCAVHKAAQATKKPEPLPGTQRKEVARKRR